MRFRSRLSLVTLLATAVYGVDGIWMNDYAVLVEWQWQGETKELRENPAQLPLCQPQIPDGKLPGSDPGLGDMMPPEKRN